MRIAMIGQRGLPATFGGIEHHVEQVGSRLAAMGHDVTIYSRESYSAVTGGYRGMTIRTMPTLNTKHLEALVHSFVSTLDSLRKPYDIVHFHAVGPGLFTPIARFGSRSAIVQTIHGLDFQRAKWGRVASLGLRISAWISSRVPHQTVVVSKALEQFYAQRYSVSTTYITNGVEPQRFVPLTDAMTAVGLEAKKYVLFVGRLVPEKAPHLIVELADKLPSDFKVVLAGDSSFTDDYVNSLHVAATSQGNVVFPGYVYGDDLHSLYANAAVFVLPSFVEGLPLSLLEAIAHRSPVVASDIEPHQEILGGPHGNAMMFKAGDVQDLQRAVLATLAEPEAAADRAVQLESIVLQAYNWDHVALSLEKLYKGLVER